MKLFQKVVLLCLFTLMLLPFLLYQSAFASTLSPIQPIADAFATNNNGFYGNTDYLTVENSNINLQANAYLKFDVSDFISSTVDNFTLKLYGHPELISNYTGNIQAFYATNQVYWDNNTPFTWNQRPVTGDEIPAGIIPTPVANVDQLFTWDLTRTAITNNANLGILTIALQLQGPTGLGYQIAATDLISNDNTCCNEGPELAPAPEPSLILLGLMGIFGLFIFKRRYFFNNTWKFA